MDGWLVIGVSGATCSGKTSLAKRIQAELKGDCAMLNQDDYFFPADSPQHIWIPELNHFNWDVITALDMPRMHADLLDIIEGSNSKQLERNDCSSHIGAKRRKILIVEGFCVLNYKPISSLCNLRYYLTLARELCWERRKIRTYDPPDVPGYFEEVVWPEHLKQKAEVMGDGDLRGKVKFLDGSRLKEDIFKEVFGEIKTLSELKRDFATGT